MQRLNHQIDQFFPKRYKFWIPNGCISTLNSILLISLPPSLSCALLWIPSPLSHKFYWADLHRICKITNCCYSNFTSKDRSTDQLTRLVAITCIYGTARRGTSQVRGSTLHPFSCSTIPLRYQLGFDLVATWAKIGSSNTTFKETVLRGCFLYHAKIILTCF